MTSSLRIIALAALALASTTTFAQAPLFRAYLSTSGNDNNPCTLASPCRLLAKAITVVQDGGEVWMLDSGNYNTQEVGIDKGVTVMSMPGVQGSLVAAASFNNTVTVVTPNPVTFRNVTFLPLPGTTATGGVIKSGTGRMTFQDCNLSAFGTYGISIGSGGDLTLIRTVMRDMPTGINVQGGATLGVHESTFAGFSNMAISVTAGAAETTRAVVTRSAFRLVNRGVDAQANAAAAKAIVHVVDSQLEASTIPAPSTLGVGAVATNGGVVEVVVSGSYISRFGRGIFVSGASPSRAQISSSHITGNQAGLAADQATTTILSAGNNLIRGNVTDINIAGTITTGAQ